MSIKIILFLSFTISQRQNGVESRVSFIGQDHQRSVDVDKHFSCTKGKKTALGLQWIILSSPISSTHCNPLKISMHSLLMST